MTSSATRATPAARRPDPEDALGTPEGAARRRRSVRLGVLGAVLVMLAFGSFNALAVPPFAAGDESSHTNHALEVASGRLPVFDDHFPPRVPGIVDTPTWTAVHPPLYYLLVAAPLRLGVEAEHAIVGLRLARLLTVLISLGAVLATARLAAALVPGRPAVAVASAGGLALITSFSQVVALVYNDALAILSVTTTLLLIALAIRRGCDRRLLALLATSAALAALTRASGLEVAALAALSATAPPAAQRSWPRLRRLGASAARAAVVAAAVGLASGWFYLRNLRLYGSFDGSTRAVAPDASGPAALDSALSAQFWLDQYRQLWGFVTTNLWITGIWRLLAHLLLAAVAAGLVLGLARWLLAGLPGLRSRLALAWGVMGLHAALTSTAVLLYFARGALPFGRYFFPLLTLAPVIAAVGLDRLPGSRRGIPTIAGLLAAAAISVGMTVLVLAGMRPPSTGGPSLAWATSVLAGHNIPAPAVVLAALLALLVTGLLLVIASVARLSRSPT